MNRFVRSLSILSLGACSASLSLAAVDLDIRADRASRVYVGSQYVGDAPLTLRNLKPGTHQILIEDVATREVRTFMIPSPEQLTVERRLDVSWNTAAYPVAAVGTSAPPPARAESVGKTHTRNALVGATVLSQILTKDGRDRKRQRNVGLGAVGLNELFRK